MEFVKFAVGEKAPIQLKNSTKVELIGGVWTFIVSMDNITQAELMAFNEDLEIGLYTVRDLIFLPLKALTNSWIISDNPFSYELLRDQDEKYLSEMEQLPIDHGMAGSIVIIDQKNNIIKKLRVFAFTHQFSKTLLAAIQKQQNIYKNGTFNKEKRDKDITDIMMRYSVQDIFNQCSTTTITGQTK